MSEDFNITLTKKPCPCPGFAGRPCTKFIVPPIINSVEGSVDEATADELIRRWNNFPELVRLAALAGPCGPTVRKIIEEYRRWR